MEERDRTLDTVMTDNLNNSAREVLVPGKNKPVKAPSIKLNALSNTTSLIVNVFFGFFMVRQVVGYLDEVQFGMWMLTASVVGYFGLLQLGVGTGVLRYAPMYRGKGDNQAVADIINTSIAFYSVLGAMIFVVSKIFAEPLAGFFGGGHELAKLIAIVGLAAAIECPSWVIDAGVRSFERFALANVLVNLKAILRVVAAAVCVRYDLGIIGLGYSLAVINMLILACGVLMLVYCCKSYGVGFGSVRPATLKMLMGFGIVVLISSAADTLTFGSAKVILGKMVSLQAVGMFGVVAMMNNYYRRTIYAVTKVFMPRFSYLQGSNSNSKIISLYQRGSEFTTIFAGLIAIMIWTCGASFVYLWLKKDFELLFPVLAIMTAGTLVLTSNRMSIDLLYGLGRQNALAVFSVLEGTAVVLCSIAGAMKFGVIGIALGVSVPVAIIRGIVQVQYVRRIVGVSFKDYYSGRILKLWLLVACMATVASMLGLDSLRTGWLAFLAIASGVTTIYMGVVYMLILDKREKTHVNEKLFSGRAKTRRKIEDGLSTLRAAVKGIVHKVFKVFATVRKLPAVAAFVCDGDLNRTYYPLEEHKSKTRIFCTLAREVWRDQ